MAKCPKCTAIIDHLLYSEIHTESGIYVNGEWINQDYSEALEQNYQCPKCLAIIAESPIKADKILNG
jgi:hypothetical protein